MSEPRPVAERDFRMPEYLDARVEDYEFRDDGVLVRKDRWERGIRQIVGIIEDMPGGCDFSNIRRRKFEVDEVVAAVEALANLAGAEQTPCAGCKNFNGRACLAADQWKDFSCRVAG